MRIRIIMICTISDQELIDNEVNLDDKAEIEEYFYAQGGVDEYEDYTTEFIIEN